MKFRTLALLFALMLIGTAACGSGEESLDVPEEEPVASANAGNDDEGEGEGDHGHDETDARDEYSKPHEVYAFVGIEPGDTVVDLLSGGGYNAIRVAELVGPEGKVIAERGNDDLRAAIESGAVSGASIEIVDDVAALPTGEVDAVLAVRAYHLFPDVPATLAELHRSLAPGGVVGIVEVRLNEATGHDMDTHRMGEDTVIADMEAAGFEHVGSSDILRRDDDDYTVFRGGERHMTDRMLLSFRKPE